MSRKKVWVTQAEFAREAGVDPSEVLRSIRRGRIQARVVRGEKRINLETELPKFLATVRHAGHLRGDEPAVTSPASGPDGAGGVDIASLDRLSVVQSREMRERYQMLQAALEYEREIGTVVEVDVIVKEWERISILMKKAIMNIADRLAPLVAAESSAEKCHAIIDGECRLVLEELSNAISDETPGIGTS